MLFRDSNAIPGRPEFYVICEENGINGGAGSCECDSVNGALNESTTWRQQVDERVADPFQVQAERPTRGRLATRRGPNRSRSLCSKPKTKKDRMTQFDLSNWPHLFIPRRGRSLDLRVNPKGDTAISQSLSESPTMLSIIPDPSLLSRVDAAPPEGGDLAGSAMGKLHRLLLPIIIYSRISRLTIVILMTSLWNSGVTVCHP